MRKIESLLGIFLSDAGIEWKAEKEQATTFVKMPSVY